MNIWIITTGEPLPLVGERAHRVGILSKMLSEKGHNVSWWTTTFDHQTKSYIKNSFSKKINNNGVNLVMLHSNQPYDKNISLNRIINHKQVSEDFKLKSKTKVKPELIFCSYPTVQLSYQAVRYGLENRVPVFIDVRDLWPDIFLHPLPKFLRPLGKIFLFNYFRKARFIFNNCDGITGVSEKYLNFGLKYAGRIKSKKDDVFPLGYDTQGENEINLDDHDFKQLNIISENFNIWFVGTFGRTYDLTTVIKVAKKIEKTHPNVSFIFTGDGEKMEIWKKESKFLKNIVFTGWVGKDELHYISSKSNIGLMAYSEGAPQGLPNKIFEYMSAGLPILSSLQTETKELISNEKLGLSYIPNNPNDLLLKLKTLISNKKLLKEMRYNSLKTFKEKFDSEIIYENLIKFLIENKK